MKDWDNFHISFSRELMAPKLKRSWKLSTLLPTRILFLEMYLQWFLVALGWVEAYSNQSLFTWTFLLFPFWYLVISNFFPLASGTPALTSRGFIEEDFVKVAEFFDAAVGIAVKIKAATKGDCMIPMPRFLQPIWKGKHFYEISCSHSSKNDNLFSCLSLNVWRRSNRN